MQLKNGYLGVKRIYTAELLQLIAAILGVVAAILGVVALAAGSESEGALLGIGAGAGALGIIAGILAIVGFILYLVGVGTAAKDSDNFKKAVLFIIIGIVASVLGTIFGGLSAKWAGYVGNVFDIIRGVAELLTVLYIVDGIIDFAAQLGDENVQQRGNTFKWLLLCVYALAILLILVELIFGFTTAGAVAGGVIGIVASVLDVVKYFFYLALLGKAKNMDWNKAE